MYNSNISVENNLKNHNKKVLLFFTLHNIKKYIKFLHHIIQYIILINIKYSVNSAQKTLRVRAHVTVTCWLTVRSQDGSAARTDAPTDCVSVLLLKILRAKFILLIF